VEGNSLFLLSLPCSIIKANQTRCSIFRSQLHEVPFLSLPHSLTKLNYLRLCFWFFFLFKKHHSHFLFLFFSAEKFLSHLSLNEEDFLICNGNKDSFTFP